MHFFGCYKLEYVYLAKTVENVGRNAFRSCRYSNFVIECGVEFYAAFRFV